MISPKSLINVRLSSGSQALIYECPTGKCATFKSIYCTNKNAGLVWVNLYKKNLDNSIVSELIPPNVPLDQNESVEVDRIVQLSAGDQLLGDATVDAVVTCEADGFESDIA